MGGLAEDPHPGAKVGELFRQILVDQFTALRDGDRFWYQNTNIYSEEFVSLIEQTTLSDIIKRNTQIGDSTEWEQRAFGGSVFRFKEASSS